MKISAGLLLYRHTTTGLEIFLEHPGGPFFTNKDDGCWSIPKGEVEENESYLDAAFRETREETGVRADQCVRPGSSYVELTSIKTSAKIYYAWAIESDIDPTLCKSNNFEVYGQTYPEVDKYAWFPVANAKIKINPKLLPFIEEFISKPTS